MTAMTAIVREQTRGELVIARLLRRWFSLRDAAEPMLPGVVAFAAELGVCPQVAISLASVFQLVEASLARPLVSALSHDSPLSPDERAVLVLLAEGVDAGPVKTARAVPHSLSGVLVWALRAARVALANDALSLPRPGYCEPVAYSWRGMGFRQWICS